MDDGTRARFDPVTRSFLDALEADPRPVWEVGVEAGRRLEAEAAEALGVPKLPAEVEDRSVAGGPADAAGVPIRIVRPELPAGPSPAVVYLHGGGWVFGSALTYDRLAREIANRARAVVVFVGYSRAPEAPYPVALEECHAVAVWLRDHGDEIGVDPGRVALAGDSAGGNLAAALTILSAMRGGPRFAGMVLLCPVTDGRFDATSARSRAGVRLLQPDEMRWFWDRYVPNPAARDEPTVSPLHASREVLATTPPTLVITAEFDVLSDEGEAYAAKLAEAGVPVTAVRYLGTIHAFMAIDELIEAPASRAAMAQVVAFLREVLGS